jgi:hypothetical protein
MGDLFTNDMRVWSEMATSYVSHLPNAVAGSQAWRYIYSDIGE